MPEVDSGAVQSMEVTRVLMDSSNWVVVTETPEEVFEERSRALFAKFPSGDDGPDFMLLTAPAPGESSREKGSVILDPEKVEGATRSIT